MELEISEAEVLAPSNKKEIKKARKGSSSRMQDADGDVELKGKIPAGRIIKANQI